jgi:hypothetical protein
MYNIEGYKREICPLTDINIPVDRNVARKGTAKKLSIETQSMWDIYHTSGYRRKRTVIKGIHRISL